jgi:hypothetical protein
MTEATYGRLEEVLLSLGFSACGVTEKNQVFRHEQTGALIIYPELPAGDSVLPRHLLMVRSILQAYGISDPTDFATKLQKAS